MAFITVRNPQDRPVLVDAAGHMLAGGDFATAADSDPVIVAALAAGSLRLVTDPGGSDLSALVPAAAAAILATRAANGGATPPVPPAAAAPLLIGTGAPDPSVGSVGSRYEDETNGLLYGPKTGAGWGTGRQPGNGTFEPIHEAHRARGAVCFVWDDGYAEQYTAMKLGSARGQRHTVGVTSGFVGTTNPGQAPTGYVSWAQVAELYGLGHEIASHSVDHAAMLSLTQTQRAAEFDNSKTAIEAVIGAGNCTTWIWPYGNNTAWSAATVGELYLRYDRLVAVIGPSGMIPMNDRGRGVIGRIDEWTPSTHLQTLDAIRMAATQPVICVIYSHQIDMAGHVTTAQVTEGLNLAQSLGVPCLTLAEAFPSNVSPRDPGFEDPTLSMWKKVDSPNGTQIAESIADTPMSGLPGSRSLHLNCNSTTGFVYVQSQRMSVHPGRSYTITGRYRVALTGGTGDFRLRVQEKSWDDATVIANNQSPALTSTTWATFSYTFVASATTSHVYIHPLLNSATGDVWVDHLHFAETRFGQLG